MGPAVLWGPPRTEHATQHQEEGGGTGFGVSCRHTPYQTRACAGMIRAALVHTLSQTHVCIQTPECGQGFGGSGAAGRYPASQASRARTHLSGARPSV